MQVVQTTPMPFPETLSKLAENSLVLNAAGL